MTYKQIRQQQYEYHKTCPYSKDWDWDSPYTLLKARYYMEGASLLTYLLQFTNIHPNFITLFYGFLGIVGGILIAIGSKLTLLWGIIIFFNKGILDLADGHLARLKHKESELGKILDRYAGVVGTYSFYVGLTIFLLKINPLVLVYYVPFYFIFKEKGRARAIDTVCVFILAFLTISKS